MGIIAFATCCFCWCNKKKCFVLESVANRKYVLVRWHANNSLAFGNKRSKRNLFRVVFFSLSLSHLFLLLLFNVFLFTRLVFFLASSYSSCKSIKTMLTPCIWFASCHTPTISNGRYFLTMPAK